MAVSRPWSSLSAASPQRLNILEGVSRLESELRVDDLPAALKLAGKPHFW